MTEVEQLWEEIDKLRRANETLVQQNADYQKLKAENERLKELIEKAYRDKAGFANVDVEKSWVQFKTENNL